MNNFKISFLITLLIVIVSSINCSAVWIEGINYHLYNDNTAAVWEHDNYGYEGDIVIPSQITYDGQVYTVTEIGDEAFLLSDVESIKIPNTVTRIRDRAFYYCYYLKEITLPESLTYLGNNAFNDCKSLKSLTILSPNVEFGTTPFFGVKLISYWGSVDLWGDYPSWSNVSVEKMFWLSNTAPPSANAKVTYVSTSNTSTDENLKRVDYLSSFFTAENGLRYIPISPQNRTAMLIDFDYSLDPDNLIIPEKVTYKGIEMEVMQAGNYCYSHIDNLKHIEVETKLPEIPDGFLYECNNVKDFVVDRYPTRIGKSAFEGCTSLADFVMLDWTTDVNVAENAFRNCGLENIRIGRQLIYPATEEASPFANNSTLESVWITDIPSSIGAYMFKGCRKLKDVSIGDRITTIDDYAFAKCSAMSRFCFGRSVKSIGSEAFSDCSAMKNLYAEPVSPPICGSQALDDINRWECTLHVQSQSKDAYASAPQWKDFLFFDYGFGLTLNVTSMYMEIGETFQLRVMENASHGNVTWKSTNENIITVSETGLVTAVGSGSASIAAINSDGLMDNCAITVAGDAGIQDTFINNDTFDGNYRVYNIQGMFVLDTTDESLIRTLPSGVYIINGKKTMIR